MGGGAGTTTDDETALKIYNEATSGYRSDANSATARKHLKQIKRAGAATYVLQQLSTTNEFDPSTSALNQPARLALILKAVILNVPIKDFSGDKSVAAAAAAAAAAEPANLKRKEPDEGKRGKKSRK